MKSSRATAPYRGRLCAVVPVPFRPSIHDIALGIAFSACPQDAQFLDQGATSSGIHSRWKPGRSYESRGFSCCSSRKALVHQHHPRSTHPAWLLPSVRPRTTLNSGFWARLLSHRLRQHIRLSDRRTAREATSVASALYSMVRSLLDRYLSPGTAFRVYSALYPCR